MVTEATFNEPEEAELLRKRLEAAGIHAEVQDERNLQRYWFMSDPLAGIHLRVACDQFEQADRYVREWDAAEGVLKRAILCPACSSSRVEFPQFTRKFILPSFYAVLCKVGVCERKFYCEACHFTWSLTEKVEAPVDILGWPIKEPPAPTTSTTSNPPANRQ